jgi:hypothetical protein
LYEHKVEIPQDDGTTETVVLSFKPIEDSPIGIMRLQRSNPDEGMWQTFEWGLDAEQLKILDKLPRKSLMGIIVAWQASGGVELGESNASS